MNIAPPPPPINDAGYATVYRHGSCVESSLLGGGDRAILIFSCFALIVSFESICFYGRSTEIYEC